MPNPLPLIIRLFFRIGDAEVTDKENIVGDFVGLYVKSVIIALKLLYVNKELLLVQGIIPFGMMNVIA